MRRPEITWIVVSQFKFMLFILFVFIRLAKLGAAQSWDILANCFGLILKK